LPADPPSYELWYTYAVGRNPTLNHRINSTLDNVGRLSLTEFDGIYDEFVGATRKTLEQVGSTISDEIEKVIGMLGELILTTTQGRGDCDEATRKLEASHDHDAVRAISYALMNSLRAVGLRYAALEHRLHASKQEVEQLQQALSTMAAEASLDPITGLCNRRHFDAVLDEAIVRAAEARQPLSLLMIDVDHFKQFNDRFGHLVGDSVLSLIGGMLKQSIKGQDTAARFGGEEFAVILPNTGLRSATTLAEQIRTNIMGRELKIRSSDTRLGSITVSIGVSDVRLGDRPSTVIERADACLYAAKLAGRNCTRFDTSPAGSQQREGG
jgi:diguanylate cyclase